MATKSKVPRKNQSAARTQGLKTVVSASTSVPAGSLRIWNLVAAGLYALQGILILLLATAKALPVTVNYLTSDPLQTAAQGKPVSALAAHHLFDLNVVYLLVAAFFVAAVFHLLLATRCRSFYEAGLARHMNRWRWAMYAIVESLVLISIGLLAGVQDAAVLVALVAASVVKNLTGLAIERDADTRLTNQKLRLGVGGVAALTQLVIVALYVFGGTVYGQVPGYLYGLFAAGVVACAALAANLRLQRLGRGKWVSYYYVEQVYMVLGLVAVSVLAWLIFAGALHS